MCYDVEKVRAQFPALHQTWRGKPLVYLDSACTTAICQAAIDAQLRYYTEFPGCVGRSAHRFGVLATKAWNESRKTVAKFLNASSSSEIVFTKNTTEAVNLVANTFPFNSGDTVLISDFEHNSNCLPWRKQEANGRVKLLLVKANEDTTCNEEEFCALLENEKPRLVSVMHKSNLSGVEFPVKRIAEAAHKHGALLMIDAAQSPLTSRIDVQDWDCDFLAFSSHKALGPSGVGVLYGKQELLEQFDSFLAGGGTVAWSIRRGKSIPCKLPDRLEAGLQNCPGVMGLAAALQTIESLDQRKIGDHIYSLNDYASKRLLKIPGLGILGPQDARSRGVVLSFRLDGEDALGVAERLNEEANVMVRAGKHCVHTWFETRGAEDWVRASFGPYNTLEECDTFCSGVEMIAGV